MFKRTTFSSCFATAMVAMLVLPQPAIAQDTALFDGTTADFWLVNPDSGQLTGYDFGNWVQLYQFADFPTFNLSNGDALLINTLPFSSVPMTPQQPAISLVGIGDAALQVGDGGEGGHRNLTLLPAGGTYTETTELSIRVSSAVLAEADHVLSWTVTGRSPGSVTLKKGTAGTDGYYTQTLHLVDDGVYTVAATLKKGAATVATVSDTYTIAAGLDKKRRDTDGDGIPDSVEVAMGLNPLTNDWTADTDGDGWSEFDEWLRQFCLDPVTKQLQDGTTCLDAYGLPLDTDYDNWSDFDEILRGTNHLDPEPVLAVQSVALGDVTASAVSAIESANFCTQDSTFYFDVRFTAEADWDGDPQYDAIFRIGADSSPFSTPTENIGINFDEYGQVSRGSGPEVLNLLLDDVADPDRWQDGPIADFNLESVGPSQWHIYGTVPVGTEPFVPGDSIHQVALRSQGSGAYYSAPYVISGNPADCSNDVLPPPPLPVMTEFEKRQRLRFKDYPAANRLYEVEHVVAAGAGTLVVAPNAVVQLNQQSQGAKQGSYAGIVVQSFTAAQDNLAGVDVVVASDEVATFDDMILNVWGDALRDGELLVSQTLQNISINEASDQEVEFRFEPVALTPGQTYYLEFRKDIANLVTTGADTLAGGAATVLDDDGVPMTGQPDIVLATWYDSSFVSGVGTTRTGMQWWTMAAADTRGKSTYEPLRLLSDGEINAGGLTPGQIAPRRRMSTLLSALAINQLPPMRLPAGESSVISVVNRYEPSAGLAWEPPPGYSRNYKTWLPRLSDVTPLAMLDELGEGSWETPDEWRHAFVDYLAPRLTLPAGPQLDIDSTLAVSVLEAALSEEARLGGNGGVQLLAQAYLPGSPVYYAAPSGQPDSPARLQAQPQYARDWEDNLQRLSLAGFSLDEAVAGATTALGSGMPLEPLNEWLRQQFLAGRPGSQSDDYMQQQLRRSFNSDCFVQAELEAELKANVEQWNEFLDQCPVYFDEAGLSAALAADQERRYQVRLNLLPGAAAEITNDPTLLDLAVDSDVDGFSNSGEVSVPVKRMTLPWLTDSDGDLIADGTDRCPNDPLNECSANPVLPEVIVDIDFTVLEPASGSEAALITVQLERLYDRPVTVYYEAIMGATDTATAGDDFEAVTGSVTIAPGQQSALIEVPIFADGADEGPEWFSVRITDIDNGVIADDGLVVVTLNDTALSAVPNIILAQTSITVDEHVSVDLDASGSTDPTNEVLSFAWQQVGGSPGVTINNSNTATPDFEAPETGQPPATGTPVDLVFEVTVTNQSLLSSTAQVTVTVNPVNDPPFIIGGTPSVQVFAGNSWEWSHAALLNYADDPENDVLSLGSITSQPDIGFVTDSGTVVTYRSAGEPALVADQESTGPISGGYGSPVVQTFIPQAINAPGFDNIAGVDAYLHGTGALTSDVTLNVWINVLYEQGLGAPVATATLRNVPRGTPLEFRFSPVQVAPGVEYALEFIIADALVMGAVIPGQYPDGTVTVGGGNLNVGADLLFTTYSDPTFNGLPPEVTVAQLSDPEVIDWVVMGSNDRVLIFETGAAADFPGTTDRIIDYNLVTGTRTLVLADRWGNTRTAPGVPVVYFSTEPDPVTEEYDVYRYEPGAAQPLISIPKPPWMRFLLRASMDPRSGDLHWCGRDQDTGDWGWFRIDRDDMSVSPQYGYCNSYADGVLNETLVVGSRMCIADGWTGFYCTDPAGNEITLYESLTTQYSDGASKDYRVLGAAQSGKSALVFLRNEGEFGLNLGLQVRLIPNGFVIPDDEGPIGPGGPGEPGEPGDPLPPEPEDPFPILFEQAGSYIDEMPVVQELPGGGAVMIFDRDEATGPGTLGQLEMWSWSGQVADTNLSQALIPELTTEASIGQGHMGKLQYVGETLYWQVQDFVQGDERIIFEIESVAVNEYAATEFARVPGSYYSPLGAPSWPYAPYDLLVAGPNTFGYLVPGDSGSQCDLWQLTPDGSSSFGADSIGCHEREHKYVPGRGLLFQVYENSSRSNLVLSGVRPSTGNTSFSIEITDGDLSVELPVNVEVLP